MLRAAQTGVKQTEWISFSHGAGDLSGNLSRATPRDHSAGYDRPESFRIDVGGFSFSQADRYR